MKIDGQLHISFGEELNKAGQRPLTIYFMGSDGIKLDIIGVRYKEGHVLNATAATPSGWVVYHTQFSTALQEAIGEARKQEPL